MPETMPWKLIYLAVLIVIPKSTYMAMDFCNGNKRVKSINIEYKATSEYKHCICHVQHTDPDASKKYTVKSIDLNKSSVRNGGYYNISFISEGETKSFVNETKGKNAELFKRSQDIATNISLELSGFLKKRKELKIWLTSGGGKLNISCRHIEPRNRTETTTVTESSAQPQGTESTQVSHTPESSAQPQETESTQVSHTPESSAQPPGTESTQVSHTPESSSDGDVTSPAAYQTPTSTVGPQGLPSTADKESDSTIPIAGGVIGGLLCIAVSIIVIFILRRRKIHKKDGPCSKTHDNPTYGAPGPDVIYDFANHVTEKSRDIHDNDAITTPPDSNYFTLEDNGGNEGYSYVNPPNVGHKDGRPSFNKTDNQEEGDDCYNHTNIAAESRDRPKGDNYVNVAARTREDYYHIKPNTLFTPGPLSNPSDKDEDSYNHPGQIPFQNTDSEDCYNHLGPSSSQPSTEDCYNHVGQNSSQATINPEDCYNRLGLLPSQITMDSDDGYSRAGHITPQTMNAEDCYNHLR